MSTQRARDEEHERILQEVLTAPDQERRRNPLPFYLAAVVAALILILWVVPGDLFPPRAKVNAIPSLGELVPASLAVPDRPDGAITAYVLSDDSEIKRVAARIVTEACSAPDRRCYADALFHFVQANIVYVYDPVQEYYELPHETLNAKAADCDGHAILLASLLRSVGILTRFNYDEPQHVAVEAWVPRHSLLAPSEYAHEWYYLDPTCKHCHPGARASLP